MDLRKAAETTLKVLKSTVASVLHPRAYQKRLILSIIFGMWATLSVCPIASLTVTHGGRSIVSRWVQEAGQS